MPKRRVRRHEVVQPQDQSIRLIPLTQGQNAVVDAADYEWLNQWNWHAHWFESSKTFYAGRNISASEGRPMGVVTMHRELLQDGSNLDTDHRNGNGLDNRRSNLRICTRSQNCQNSPARMGRSG